MSAMIPPVSLDAIRRVSSALFSGRPALSAVPRRFNATGLSGGSHIAGVVAAASPVIATPSRLKAAPPSAAASTTTSTAFAVNPKAQFPAEALASVLDAAVRQRIAQESHAFRLRLNMEYSKQLRVLLLTNAHNSMSQAAYLELQGMGHEVMVELAVDAAQMTKCAQTVKPDLIICPFLTKVVPAEVYHNVPTFIIHPGIQGDRGMSSIDWALLEGKQEWGVTIMEAHQDMDAGPVWSTKNFDLERANPHVSVTKSMVYKHEGIRAAMSALHEAMHKFCNAIPPTPLDYNDPTVKGTLKPTMKQADCAIDWNAPAAEIVARISARDGQPGVLDNILDTPVFLYGAHVENGLKSLSAARTSASYPGGTSFSPHTVPPKTIVGQRHGAICLTAGDGNGVWITHLKRQNLPEKHFFKLPATWVLPQAALRKVPILPVDLSPGKEVKTWREIWYTVEDQVCYLHFEFYNGAMSTEQCQRLTKVVDYVASLPNIKVIVFMGGYSFFSNGIHLNTIEANKDPAKESMNNIVAMDDLCLRIMQIKDKVTVAALQGNAGAGGVMLALCADQVYAHRGVVLNPHYRTMGLFGSEYWTYNLPRRVGAAMASELTESALPVGAERARRIGLIDHIIGDNVEQFNVWVKQMVANLADSHDLDTKLLNKQESQNQGWADELLKCRQRELANMNDNFKDVAYIIARKNFVYKKAAAATPHHLITLGNRKGNIMDGVAAAGSIIKKITAEVGKLKETTSGRRPGLACILVGDKSDSKLFVKMKMKRAEEAGFLTFLATFEAPSAPEQEAALLESLVAKVHEFNQHPEVDGILVQLPLPKGVDQAKVLMEIRKEKDVDGLLARNIGKMAAHQEPGDKAKFFMPCTVRGIIELLKIYDVKLVGKSATVVGSSQLVGVPAAIALTKRHATVTVAHLHTRKLREHISRSDIVVSATGVPGVIKGEWIKEGAVVVDAGIHAVTGPDGKSKVSGDVEYEEALKRAALITPVPRGVGPMTIAMLLQNTLDSFKSKLATEAKKPRVSKKSAAAAAIKEAAAIPGATLEVPQIPTEPICRR